jgi:hypothetical protein
MLQPATLDSLVQALNQTNSLLLQIARQGEFGWSQGLLRSLPGVLAGVVTGALSSLALQRWALRRQLREDFERHRLRCEFAHFAYDLWFELRVFREFLLEHPTVRKRKSVKKFYEHRLDLKTAPIPITTPTFPNGVVERYEDRLRAELKELHW